jgi:hypothetical protein
MRPQGWETSWVEFGVKGSEEKVSALSYQRRGKESQNSNGKGQMANRKPFEICDLAFAI